MLNIPLKCAWVGRAKALRYKENGTTVFSESLRDQWQNERSDQKLNPLMGSIQKLVG